MEGNLQYQGQLEIIQERDSEQLDVDQFHQKILDQTQRISNFNPEWCNTTSDGPSSKRKLSTRRFENSKKTITDTPKSNLSGHQQNKKLFFESFKNHFSIENSRQGLNSQTSGNKNQTSMRGDSKFSLQGQSGMDETADQPDLLRRFQEKLLESKPDQPPETK